MKRTELQTAKNQKKKGNYQYNLALSIVSLFSDTVIEILYPVMPIFYNLSFFLILLIAPLEGMAKEVAFPRNIEQLILPFQAAYNP